MTAWQMMRCDKRFGGPIGGSFEGFHQSATGLAVDRRRGMDVALSLKLASREMPAETLARGTNQHARE
ncbi:MAG: hypothetical protein AB7G13_36005 [Lautropia sp.]